MARSSSEFTPITSQDEGTQRRPSNDNSTSNWLSRARHSNVKSGRASTATRAKRVSPYHRSTSDARRLHASCSARRQTASVVGGRRRNASVAAAAETDEDLKNLKGLVNKTWRVHRMSPMHKFSAKKSSLCVYSRHLSAHVESTSSKQLVAIDETADLACMKPLKLKSVDKSKILTGIEIELLQLPKQGSGVASVVLTAVLCTVENYSADVTLGGVDSEFTSLPLVLIRGPVRLRQLLIAWWQCQFDCCLSPVLMSPMELSWMVGMFSGFIPDSHVKDVELIYKLPHEVTDLSNIVYRIHAQDCQQLWQSIHTSEDDSFRTDEVVAFVHAIEKHLYVYFRIKLAALQLSRIGTSILYVSGDGGLKIYSVQHIFQILSHLSCIVQEATSSND